MKILQWIVERLDCLMKGHKFKYVCSGHTFKSHKEPPYIRKNYYHRLEACEHCGQRRWFKHDLNDVNFQRQRREMEKHVLPEDWA